MRKWICCYCRAPVMFHDNHVADARCRELSMDADCSGTFEHRDRGSSCKMAGKNLTHEDVYLLPLGVSP